MIFWISQLCILILGPLAVMLASSKRRQTRCWAGFVGLCSQPFWAYSTWTAGQYLIFAVTWVYCASWLAMIWNNRKTIYIAGPMRGYPYYNFHRFFEIERMLRWRGWNVMNPARMDVEDYGFDPRVDPDIKHEDFGFDYEDCMRRDLAAIEKCSAIFLLSGWEGSQGANRELAHAKAHGLMVLREVK